MSKKILQGAILLGISSLASRLLGVLRDYLFTDIFGATQGTGIFDIDTYYAAFRLPDLLFNLLIYGALSTAFVPIFSQYLSKKQQEKAWKFANNSLHILLSTLLAISVLLFIFSPQIVDLFFYGFTQEKRELTTELTRIMLISPILFGLSSFAQSLQTSFKTFLLYSLAPVAYNLSIIIAAYFFGKEYGVYAITYGVVIGAGLHFLTQVPALFKLGYKYKFTFQPKAADIKEMFRLLGPRILGLAVMQFNILVDHFLAALLFSGSLAIINYANNLNSLPLGVVGISFATASFATLSEFSDNKKAFKDTLHQNIKNILSLIIPATVALIILSPQIVQMLLSGSAMSTKDQELTALTLSILALSLFAQSLIPLIARGFYALKNTKTPLKAGITAFSLNIALSLLFAFQLKWGIYGLAAANSIAAICNLLLLSKALKETVGKLGDALFHDIKAFCLGSLLLAAAILGLKFLWINYLGALSGRLELLIFLLMEAGIGLYIYFLYLRRKKVNIFFKKIS